MDKYEDILFIGEDILSPYGGAFKATKELSSKYPDRVLTTPISEAAIAGISSGLALNGFRPYAEIMFGDFMTLILDQIINHASKFHLMYNKKVNCPVVIRTPMGGRRGYGPTHSQTLDKLLIGINNIKVVALNFLISPLEIYENVYKSEEHPVIVLENKMDYSKKYSRVSHEIFHNYKYEKTTSNYPTLHISPKYSKPDLTLITYGGTLEDALCAVETLFFRHDILGEIVVLTQISPLPLSHLKSAIQAKTILVIEEGSKEAGFGSEVLASLIENGQPFHKIKRVTSISTAIPASHELEKQILVNPMKIVSAALEIVNGN
jgi:2-oxoisovalerate dehydrogenase E1 component